MNYLKLSLISIHIALATLLMAGCGSPVVASTPIIGMVTSTSQPESTIPFQPPSSTPVTKPTVCLESPTSPRCELIGRWDSPTNSMDFSENGSVIIRRFAAYSRGDYEWLNDDTVRIRLPDGEGGYIYYNAILSEHDLILSGNGIWMEFSKSTQ